MSRIPVISPISPRLDYMDEFQPKPPSGFKPQNISPRLSGRISRPSSPIITAATTITNGVSPLPNTTPRKTADPGPASRITSPRGSFEIPKQRPKSPRDTTPIILDGKVVDREMLRRPIAQSPRSPIVSAAASKNHMVAPRTPRSPIVSAAAPQSQIIPPTAPKNHMVTPRTPHSPIISAAAPKEHLFSPRTPVAQEQRRPPPSRPSAVIIDMMSREPPPDDNIIIAAPATETVSYQESTPRVNIPSISINDPVAERRNNENLRPRYDLLSKVPGVHLPAFAETGSYEDNFQNFQRENRLVAVRKTASYCRIVIIGYAVLVEWFCGSVLHLDMGGFIMNQVQILADYDSLVFEIAESWTGDSQQAMRPEYRLLLLVMANSVIFAIAKAVTSKVGFNVYPLIRGLQGASVPSGEGAAAGGGGGFDLGGLMGMLGGFFGGNSGGPSAPPADKPAQEARRRPVFNE